MLAVLFQKDQYHLLLDVFIHQATMRFVETNNIDVWQAPFLWILNLNNCYEFHNKSTCSRLLYIQCEVERVQYLSICHMSEISFQCIY